MSFVEMKEKEMSLIKREQGVRALEEGLSKLRGEGSGGGRGVNRGRVPEGVDVGIGLRTGRGDRYEDLSLLRVLPRQSQRM